MRITPITVWVVSKNESNCRLENKMVSTFIWRKVRQYCTLFSQTFYGLLLSYPTITDVTSYVHHKFPVLSCCTAQPKKLNQIITVNSSMNVPITKNNSCTLCVPMFKIIVSFLFLSNALTAYSFLYHQTYLNIL